MKVFTPEVVWHEKQPILSVDFHQSGRLASCGADNFVRIWRIKDQDGNKITPSFVSELSRHSSCVNIVRFSPNGALLASAGDDCVICLWKCNGEGEKTSATKTSFASSSSGVTNQESWSVTKILRGHQQDIYDMCWSCDAAKLISASVNHTAVVWDVSQAIQLAVLCEHQLYVQGVTWDPIGCYLATISSDKQMRLYTTSNYQLHATVGRMTLPCGDHSARISFHDETISSFFRRLSFSPDGMILVVPAGRVDGISKLPLNVTYVYSRNDFSKPVAYLPAGDTPTIAVRFSPVIYQLHTNTSDGDSSASSVKFIDLPYRMVYAVASQNAIVLYDTQSTCPFGYISNIHYASITDLTWSSDGLILVASSSDGYCTIVRFDSGELGVPFADSEPVGTRVKPTTNDNSDVSPPVMHTVGSVLPSSSQTTPHRNISQMGSSPDNSSSNRKPGPRRVQLITLSSTPQSAAAATTTNTGDATTPTQHNTCDTSVAPASTNDSIVIL